MKNLMTESVLYITGRKNNLKVNGPLGQVNAYKDVLNASKRLYEALNDERSRLSEIEKLVTKKNLAAAKYKKITGETWPL